MLHELVMVLAGCDTSLNESDFSHNSEYSIFEEAKRFGRGLRALMDACICHENELTLTLEENVTKPILTSLVDVEAMILKNSIPVTEVMVRTARRHRPLLDYGLNLLSIPTVYGLWMQLSADKIYGETTEIRTIAQQYLVRADRAWVHSLESTLIWGESLNEVDPLEYPLLDEGLREKLSDIIDSVTRLQPLNRSPAIVSKLKTNFGELQRLDQPITGEKLHSALTRIQISTRDLIVTEVLSDKKISALIEVLRKIVLQGSGLFRLILQETDGDLNKVFAEFKMSWANDSVSDNALALCQELFRWSPLSESVDYSQISPFDELAGGRLEFNEIKWPLTYILDERHCLLYSTFFSFLIALQKTLTLLEIGSVVDNRISSFLSAIWLWCQERCDLAMDELRQVISAGNLDWRNKHGLILKSLAHDLLLDDSKYRTAMSDLLSGARMHQWDSIASQNIRSQLAQRNVGVVVQLASR